VILKRSKMSDPAFKKAHRHDVPADFRATPGLPRLPNLTSLLPSFTSQQGNIAVFATGILFAVKITPAMSMTWAHDVSLSREDTAMQLQILEMKTPWPLVNLEEEEGELVVSFHPEAFLWPAVEDVGTTLLGLVNETDGGQFILDFDHVDYLSGVGLEKLVVLNKKLQCHGRRLMIKNVGPNLLKVFSIAGLTRDFAISAPGAHRLTV
jgi:anti-anti-sigma factor